MAQAQQAKQIGHRSTSTKLKRSAHQLRRTAYPAMI
jgi:hypothetical protein